MDLSMMKATDTSMGSASSATVDIRNKENSVSVSATIQRKIISLNPQEKMSLTQPTFLEKQNSGRSNQALQLSQAELDVALSP